MIAIHTNNIFKSFEKNTVHALNDISIDIQQGELFGLIGPDGAGKTTLIRILASLILADKGNASILGFDPVSQYKEVRRIIGYMPGRFSLYHDLSVEENLEFFASVFQTKVKDNYHLIKELYDQLAPFKNRRAGNLSGGMKQKLALCCALIHEPQLLLLDEPTTGVDPVSRKEFWDMLLRLKSRNITILVSTPYMDEAKLCDRIALIQDGHILETGSPEEICKNYHKAIYAVSAKNMYALLLKIREYTHLYSCHAFGNAHHVQLMDSSVNQFADFLSTFKFPDLRVEIIEPGIEDIFMDKLKERA